MKRLLIAIATLALFAHDALACAPNWIQNAKSDFWVEGGVRAADLDGDGRADLAGVQKWGALIALTGTDGKPGAQQLVHEGHYLLDLQIADVQNDGKADLILSDIAVNQLIVLPGNGDGTFGAAVATQLPISATRIVVRDFTNDGKLDVAFRSYSASAISVWQGDGANGFTHLSTSSVANYTAILTAGDFDDDGFEDLATAMPSAKVDVLFGNGDGTFDAPVTLTAGGEVSAIRAGDLDGDGDTDFTSADRTTDKVTVYLHTGSRTFNVASYNARPGTTPVTPSEVAISDVTQDGHPDLVVALVTGRKLATFVNNGNGTFRNAMYAPVPSSTSSPMFPVRVVAGAFDLDGRNDVLVVDTSNGFAALFLNNCGESKITVAVLTPMITVGQTAQLNIRVASPDSDHPGDGRPIATGTVHVKEGAIELAQSTLDSNGYALVSLTGLAAGEHALTIHYDGDEIYDPRDSDAVTQKVTTETTTVQLTIIPAGGTGYYGQQLEVSASATASNGGTPTGTFRLIVDGVQRDTWYYGPPATLRYSVDVGTYEFYVEYAGDANYPPSVSETHTLTIQKSPTSISNGNNPAYAKQGQTVEIYAGISGQYGGYPTGTVKLYDGETLLGTMTKSSGTSIVTFNVSTANLAIGDHWLTFTYGGDAHFEPARGESFRLTVVPDIPLAVNARAENGQISVVWYSETFYFGEYKVQRLDSGVWTTVYTTYNQFGSYIEPSPSSNTPYVYRVLQYGASGTVVQTSNVDSAMLANFTDDPFVPGVTKIKAAHVTELVSAVNALRNASALAPFSLPNVAPGKTMNALDIQTLRNALNDARTNAGMAAHPFQEILTAKSTRIKATHLQELRDLLR